MRPWQISIEYENLAVASGDGAEGRIASESAAKHTEVAKTTYVYAS